jgi:hypothetical protein
MMEIDDESAQIAYGWVDEINWQMVDQCWEAADKQGKSGTAGGAGVSIKK